MFAIDLLKGKGTPAKNGFRKTVLKAVPFLIPAMAVVLWAASYQQDCTQIHLQKDLVEKNQTIIDDARADIKEYRQLKGHVAEVKRALETITKGLHYRIQVTDLVVELTQSLPDQIFLYEIDLNRSTTMEKLPQEGNKEPKQQLLVQRKMKLIVCSFDPIKSDFWVREYVNKLKASQILKSVFTDIKPAARRQGYVDQKPATYYEIECTLAGQR